MPTHFADNYKLKRSLPPQKLIGELNEGELSVSINKAQEELIEQARRMADEFATAVKRYLNLDELHPDRVNGPAQA